MSENTQDIEEIRQQRDVLLEACKKISYAVPDLLDHSLDIAIIKRAVKVAKAAISEVNKLIAKVNENEND